MIEFKPISIEDKEDIVSYILPSDAQDCDLSFANLCSWHFLTDSSYAIIHDQLVIRFITPKGTHEYFMPFGSGSLIPVIEELEQWAQDNQEVLCLKGISPQIQDILEQVYPTTFDYTSDRDYFDYIYNRKDLVELKGKNYQPKRNHFNKFKKEYQFSYEPLTTQFIPECLQFESEWSLKHGYIENENIRNERRALTYALHHFNELELSGGVIHDNGKIVAFTFGAPINHNTFGVQYEKADITVDGIYSAINQMFASQLPDQYLYLNREEDLGIPGLRQAKQSYHPVTLLEKTKAWKRKQKISSDYGKETAGDRIMATVF